jgi:type II secretion system protein G
MTKHEGMPNRGAFCSSFGIRHLSFRAYGATAFTLLELLIVMTIIAILAGITYATLGYASNKARRSRAEAEIAAISAALENYKADNGEYPTDDQTTETLDPTSKGDPTAADYQNASLSLYKLISGDADNDSNRAPEAKSYFSFKSNQLFPEKTTDPVKFIRDPFLDKTGKACAYGYSTEKAKTGTGGYNPTFDLWSTAGETAKKPTETWEQYQARWIKNW